MAHLILEISLMHVHANSHTCSSVSCGTVPRAEWSGEHGRCRAEHIKRQIKGIQQPLVNVRTCSGAHSTSRVSADAAWDDELFFGERYRKRAKDEGWRVSLLQYQPRTGPAFLLTSNSARFCFSIITSTLGTYPQLQRPGHLELERPRR